MDIEKLIEQLNDWNENLISELCADDKLMCDDLCDGEDCIVVKAATALSTLRAENEKLRAELYSLRPGFQNQKALIKQLRTELEQVKRLYESEKEDFIDFVCSGVPNLSPYCLNRHPDCVDERGWCRTEKCRGFSRERGQKED